MTADQFTALAKLLRMQPGPTQDAVCLHLVYGRDLPEAARRAGADYKAAWNSVQRVQEGLQLAERAAGGGSGLVLSQDQALRILMAYDVAFGESQQPEFDDVLAAISLQHPALVEKLAIRIVVLKKHHKARGLIQQFCVEAAVRQPAQRTCGRAWFLHAPSSQAR